MIVRRVAARRRPLVLLAALAPLAWGIVAPSPLPAPPPTDRYAYGEAWAWGPKLLELQVSQFEERLKEHPDDLDTRVRLIGYYRRHAPAGPDGARRPGPMTDLLHGHLLWIVENRPKSGLAGELPFDSKSDAALYQRAAALWNRHLDQNAQSPEILWNAAQFFFISDPNRGVELMQRGRQLEPNEPEWEKQLTRFTNLSKLAGLNSGDFRVTNSGASTASSTPQGTASPAAPVAAATPAGKVVPQADLAAAAKKDLAKRRLADLETAMGSAATPEARTAKLGDAAEAAYEAGELDKASTYAGELLAHTKTLAAGAPDDDAAFRSHMVMGRVALARGDAAAAKEHLRAAAEAPASVKLNTAGPTFTLARELLAAGERAAAVEFLELRKKTWPANNGVLDRMIAAVNADRDPSAVDNRWSW